MVAPGDWVVVQADGRAGVAFRPGGQDSEPLEQDIPNHTELECLEGDGAEWLRVSWNDLSGWVASRDVRPRASRPTLHQLGIPVSQRLVAQQAEDHPSGVAFRVEKASFPVRDIENGEEVEWLDDDGVWTQIRWEGRQGWVRQKNLLLGHMVAQHADGGRLARNPDGSVPLMAAPGAAPHHHLPNGFEVDCLRLDGELAFVKWVLRGGQEGWVHWRHLRPRGAPRGFWARCANLLCACTASANGEAGAFCCQACHDGQPCATNLHDRPLQPLREIPFAPCARQDCPCAASYDGAYGSFCCTACRDGVPCAEGIHLAPATPAEQPEGVEMSLVHGTSRRALEGIRLAGWRPSGPAECLGAGVYFVEEQEVAKSMRFAHDVGKRFGDGEVPVLIYVTCVVGKVKRVDGDDRGWEAEGFDACRGSKTSLSVTPEWCVSRRSAIRIDRVVELTRQGGHAHGCPFKATKHWMGCWAEKKGQACPCE